VQASTAVTPTAEHCGTIFVAIELSQKSWLLTVHGPDRDRMSRHKLEGGDHAGLLALIVRAKARAAEKLGSVPEVVSCYEAGYDGFWLHRLLEAAGIRSLVFDAASIAVEQRTRRAKTDRIDGELLLRTLMAYLRGEPRVVRIVRVPSVEAEDAVGRAQAKPTIDPRSSIDGFRFAQPKLRPSDFNLPFTKLKRPLR
jgi:transposase